MHWESQLCPRCCRVRSYPKLRVSDDELEDDALRVAVVLHGVFPRVIKQQHVSRVFPRPRLVADSEVRARNAAALLGAVLKVGWIGAVVLGR